MKHIRSTTTVYEQQGMQRRRNGLCKVWGSFRGGPERGVTNFWRGPKSGRDGVTFRRGPDIWGTRTETSKLHRLLRPCIDCIHSLTSHKTLDLSWLQGACK